MSPSQPTSILNLSFQEMVRWALLLLVILTGIGSLIDGGALSNGYDKSPIMFYIPVIITLYFGIIAAMFAMGLQPSKFEMIFIPTLLVGVVVVVLSQANIIPQPDSELGNAGSAEVTDTSSQVLSRITTIMGSSGPMIVTTYVTVAQKSRFQVILGTLGTAFALIAILVIMIVSLYIMVKRQNFMPEITMAKVQEYAKPSFQSNKNIIEYYILTSEKIEQFKGKAPDWFSPTFFAEHVDDSPGPPLSSYFDRITELYELARFSELEMSNDQVDEAKELHQQIVMQLEELIIKLSKMEGKR